MSRLNETESAVFLYCSFSLFLKDPFFSIVFRSKSLFSFARDLFHKGKSDLSRS